MRKIWHNGVIKPESEAVYSAYSESMMLGTTCFEMQRTFNKITFKLHEHLDRLANSCKILEIPFDKEVVYYAHEELLQYHTQTFPEVEEWRLLINVQRGILPIYQRMLKDDGKPDTMITCFPLSEITKGMSWVYDGVKAIVPSQRALPHHLLDSRLKTRSRQHLKMANLEIEKIDKHAFPLLLDPDGFISESTGSNFFIVQEDGYVYTPYGRNCLRGISREFVMTLEQFPIYEENITLYDVITADEAFLTNTPYAIIPCTSVNGHPIGNGKVGPMTKQITQTWIDSVGCDFISQMRRWDKI